MGGKGPYDNAEANKLPASVRAIFDRVYDAMQDAEEIWGVEGKDYLALMHAIAREAKERIEGYEPR